MSWRVASPCQQPGCPERAIQGGYCQAHQRQRPARQADQERPNAAARGYDYRWQKFRAEYLARNPYCARCGKPATDVHHPWRLEDGGPQYDEANCMPLCHRCHSAITMGEGRG